MYGAGGGFGGVYGVRGRLASRLAVRQDVRGSTGCLTFFDVVLDDANLVQPDLLFVSAARASIVTESYRFLSQ